MRNLTVSILLAFGLAGSAVADNTANTSVSAPQTQAIANASEQPTQVSATPTSTAPGTTATPTAQNGQAEGLATTPNAGAIESTTIESVTETVTSTPDSEVNSGFAADLSVFGMYENADIVVKTVMIGLIIASIITWALFFSKGVELIKARRRLRREMKQLLEAKTLEDAGKVAEGFGKYSISQVLIQEAMLERDLSEKSTDASGTKERVAFRLERVVAAIGRSMGRGNGYLATIGAISPFVGLFGTVWGIMNSFIGIAHSQTTNLAVVAPGIAEALLATALGLVAAIPAVVIYNIFARTISTYRGEVGDMAAHAILWMARDLDLANSKAR